MKTLKELLKGATPGPWGYDLNHTVGRHEHGEWAESVVQLPSGAQWRRPFEQEKSDMLFIARCNPATMRLVLEALELADLNFQRTNRSNPELLFDDDHEAWAAIQKALAALNGASHGEQGEGR